MTVDLDALIEQLGAVLAVPDAPRRLRIDPGVDKKWKAGDLLKGVPAADMKAVAQKVGIPVGQLRSYAKVARAFPPTERTMKASWATYRELADVPVVRRAGLLRDGLTERQARLAIDKEPIDRRTKKHDSDDDRAWAVIGELQEPRIRAIVEREMRSSSADRRARRAMKTTLDEIAARRKFIDAELRKQARESAPERRYWEASRELVDAERFIYSVARLHEEHADAMSGERWVEIVQKLGQLADSALDVAHRIEGPVVGDYIDAEVVEDDLVLPAGSKDDRDIVDVNIADD